MGFLWKSGVRAFLSGARTVLLWVFFRLARGVRQPEERVELRFRSIQLRVKKRRTFSQIEGLSFRSWRESSRAARKMGLTGLLLKFLKQRLWQR